ncbi:MAG: metallophosphoesterase family protein [Thermomicrobiales bacterium]
MKIAVITDVHANLPALDAALAAIKRDGCDAIYHTGDAIAIGPYPAETLDLLLATPGMRFVMGNHDEWFAHGLPEPRPDWMSDGELAHQRWTHAQIDPALRTVVAGWPFVIEETIDGVPLTFLHYGLASSRRALSAFVVDPDAGKLDALFADESGVVICFGHDHRPCDVIGRARYVNPGSLGCHPAVTCFATLTVTAGACQVEHHAAPYDVTPVLRAFERRQVPERAFIVRTFFAGDSPDAHPLPRLSCDSHPDPLQ